MSNVEGSSLASFQIFCSDEFGHALFMCQETPSTDYISLLCDLRWESVQPSCQLKCFELFDYQRSMQYCCLLRKVQATSNIFKRTPHWHCHISVMPHSQCCCKVEHEWVAGRAQTEMKQRRVWPCQASHSAILGHAGLLWPQRSSRWTYLMPRKIQGENDSPLLRENL